MSNKLNYPTWNGRKIVKEADKHDLESRAAVLEFKHRMARPDAEHSAYHQYRQDQLRESAAHHYQGLKAAQAAGSHEEGHKHGMMYQLAMKELGLDPMGPVPHEIQGLADKQEKFYRFKAHRGDAFLLQSDGMKKAEKCWNSGQWTTSREAARAHHCSCGASLEVTPRRNPKVAGETLPGWHVKIPAHPEGGHKTEKSERQHVPASPAHFKALPVGSALKTDSGHTARKTGDDEWTVHIAGDAARGLPPTAGVRTGRVTGLGEKWFLDDALTKADAKILPFKGNPAPKQDLGQKARVAGRISPQKYPEVDLDAARAEQASADRQRVEAVGLKEKQALKAPASWDAAVKETAAAGPQKEGNVTNIATKRQARLALARTKVQNTLNDAVATMAEDPGFKELARQRETEAKKAKLKAGGQLFRPGQTVTHVDQKSVPWKGQVTSANYRENDIDGPGHYYEVKWWNPKANQYHEDYLHQDNLKPG